MFSSLVVGVVSLAVSVAGGALGIWVALERSTLEFGPPEDLFTNAIVMIGAALVAALGGLVGFFLAVTTLPPLAVWFLGWSRPLLTGLMVFAFEIVATPLVVWVIVFQTDGTAADALIPIAALLLGGVLPGLARWLAFERPPQPVGAIRAPGLSEPPTRG